MDSNIKPLPQQQQQDSKLHFLDYWRIIRIRKTIILTVFLLILLTTIGVTYYLPASYSATARMRVEKDTPDIGLFGGLTSPQQQYDPFWLLTEFEVIQSSKILYPVIERLELQKDYAKRLKSDSPLSIKDTFEMLSRDVDVKQFRNTSILEVRAFAPTAAGAAGGEELHVVEDDLDFAALLAAGLVLPLVELEATFDEDAGALAAVGGEGVAGDFPGGGSVFFAGGGVGGGVGDREGGHFDGTFEEFRLREAVLFLGEADDEIAVGFWEGGVQR